MAEDINNKIRWKTPASVTPGTVEGVMEAFYRNKGTCVRRIGIKREVWRVPYRGECFYVKHARYNFFQGLACALGLKGLKNEFSAAMELDNIAVPVSSVVGYGAIRENVFISEEFIITRGVKKSQTLKDFFFANFSGKFSRKEKKEFIRDFAAFFRSMHDKGVVHRDPHLGNILVRRDNGRYGFYLLDLQKVRMKSPFLLRERWENLVFLNLNFISNVESSLKFYFFKLYSRGLIEKREDLRGVIEMIENKTLSIASKVFSKRVKRCMRTNKVFEHAQDGALEVYKRKSLCAVPGIKELLSFPDRFLNGSGARILKDGGSVAEGIVKIKGGGRFELRRYGANGRFRNPSGARAQWKKSYMAELREVNMPRAVAYMEERGFLIPKRSYVISECMNDGVRLNDFSRAAVLAMTGEERRAFFHSLGAEVGRMHRRGWFHGALDWDNIFVKNKGAGFYFLNMDSGRPMRNASLSDAANDLAPFIRDMEKSPVKEDMRWFIEGYLKGLRSAVTEKEFSLKVEKALSRAMGVGA
ncbi:MAG: hypothetical protein HY883_03810 [Deltaproteobacteria bacterium]|nr:hypothetical protein [Deltaproteobacteria bacterium]